MNPSGKEIGFSSSALEVHGEELLRLRLQVRHVMVKCWKLRGTLPENVVDTHRLIFLTAGELDYRVENIPCRFAAPGILYVPGWVRRSWKSVGPVAAKMSWVEFSSDIMGTDIDAPIFLKGKIPDLDRALFEDLWKRWPKRGNSPGPDFVFEPQAKTLLARFFERCRGQNLPREKGAATHASDLEVQRLVDYFKAHFAEAGVLQAATARVQISQDYMRRLFYRHTGHSMQAYVTRLRMRKARYLLNGTALRIKEVADQSGYRDPLRFSKIYREFWGYPPSAERKK